jgi:hypothetical protein
MARSMIVLSAFQNLATGAFIGACADAGALAANWLPIACLMLFDGLFVCYILNERKTGKFSADHFTV